MIKQLHELFHTRHYDLTLDIDRDALNFSGEVTIHGQLMQSAKAIKLHTKDLKIDEATIDGKPASKITHGKFDELSLSSTTLLTAAEHTVKLKFSGQITEPMHGMYPCNFEVDGMKKQLIATQFESHHAREVFPCIDEPAAKATFDLTLITPSHEPVLANTPLKTQHEKNHRRTTTFETTPKMSTYLLAFVFGEMEAVEATTAGGVLVRCWSTPDKAHTLDFSLQVATQTLEYYNEYFGIDYPLKKCDMVALPDFSSGAMENWGLITYRESCMLVDEKNTSQPTKQYVAMVVAHELAHQWFGNLVTMKWWNDLWLNEGFASWIEYLAVDHLFPDWQMWTQFIVDEKLRAQSLDALENTHPIEVEVNDPAEIRTIFDAISYQKGASVIGMLHQYLGPEDFRKGLGHYLKRHAYQNAETNDLWIALSEKSGKNVASFMHAWTSQPGFPLVSVEQEKHQLTVGQQRFTLQATKQPVSTLWPIPLDTQARSLPELLTQKRQRFTPDTAEVLLNHSGLNLYISRYNQLPQTLTILSIPARLLLLSDSFTLAKAGFSPTIQTLDLLARYTEEDQAPVWDIMAGVVGSIRLIMDSDAIREDLKPLLRSMSKQQVGRLGWHLTTAEPYFDTLLRPLVLGLASLGGEKATVTQALGLFDQAGKPEDIAADLRGVIYGTVVRERDDTQTYNQLLEWFDVTNSPEDKITLASALMAFKNPELLQRSITELKGSHRVKPQDLAYWLIYGLRNRHARTLTWEWIKANWEWILEQFGSDMHLGDFIKYPADVFSTLDELKDYRAFFKQVKTPGQERTIKQGLEKIAINVAWRKRDESAIAKWLAKYNAAH